MHKLLQKYMRCKKYRNYLRIAKNSAKYRNVCANICKNIRSAKQKYKYLRENLWLHTALQLATCKYSQGCKYSQVLVFAHCKKYHEKDRIFLQIFAGK